MAENYYSVSVYSVTDRVNNTVGGTVKLIYNDSIGYGSFASYNCLKADRVTASVTTNSNYVFYGWYESLYFDFALSTNVNYNFSVYSSKTLYARFETATSRKVEVKSIYDHTNSTPIGSYVTAEAYDNPNHVNNATYEIGEIATVTAIPIINFQFLGWYDSEDTCILLSTDTTYSFEVTDNILLYADFKEVPEEEMVETSSILVNAYTGGELSSTGGTVKAYEESLNDDSQDSQLYVASDDLIVTVIATAKEGYEFVAWHNTRYLNSVVSTSASYTFHLSEGSHTLYAQFSPIGVEEEYAYLVIYACDDSENSIGGFVIVVGSDSSGTFWDKNILKNEVITINVNVANHFEFVGWYTSRDFTTLVSSDAEYTFTITEATTLYARFISTI